MSSLYALGQQQEVLLNDVLGHGFDIRYVDALDWGASSKGRALVKGGNIGKVSDTISPTSYHFVTTPYEFERELLQTNITGRPYLAVNAKSHYKPLREDGSDKLLFVYTRKSQALLKKYVVPEEKYLDSAMIEDFRRLGRDITPSGFIYRYGTHYAQEVLAGGRFLQRHSINVDDYIYSPYNEQEFKENVIKEVTAIQNHNEDTTPFIKASKTSVFTIGGEDQASSPEKWLPTVSKNPRPIEVKLQKLSDLLRTASISGIDNKVEKLRLLDSIITDALSQTQSQVKQVQKGSFYKKYSLQFNQEITSIVKKSVGKENIDQKAFTGDIFFGGFSKDEAILKTRPLIERGGLRLETLITDEKIRLDKSVLITIKPEDIRNGYVSVWDDTKKLFKDNGRTNLRISGPPEAHTSYQEALRQVITKQVIIETIDKDVYEIEYRLSLIKPQEIIENFAASYNYILDSEILAAVSNGNINRLDSLFASNGNPRADGLIESIIINKHSNKLLNYVLDKGAQPTTSDLDLLFEPENFDEKKVLILLERGAKPKNNMIYKAVAYRSAPVIYALFREGATAQNNDLALALKGKDYNTIKALMSSAYEPFPAGKSDLSLAVSNNDEALAKKFIDLGAISDAEILSITLEKENPNLESIIVPVTEASSAALEVAAKNNKTALFSYLLSKNAILESNTSVEIAIDNNNTTILNLALKNGGDPTQALQYAIKKENRDAIIISLQNKAEPDTVFEYATAIKDESLFNDALNLYGGTPSIALDQAVKRNSLPMATTVLKSKAEDINPSESVPIAVTNENLEMLSLLIDNKANPTEGMSSAIEIENVSITEYLISKGAETTDPKYLQETARNNNLELTKLLVEKGKAKADNAIIDAAIEGNLEIVKFLLDKGAYADEALREAMETTHEEVILFLMDKVKKELDSEYLLTASRKGNNRVVRKLIEDGFLDPTAAIISAIKYNKSSVLSLLLENGGIPKENDFIEALELNFFEGIALLLNKGFFNANTAFKNGNYPLHITASSYEPIDSKIVLLLLEKGAYIDAQNDNGDTPLHIAARLPEVEIPIVQLLLNNSANAQITNYKKETPLNLANAKPIKNLLRRAARRQN